MGEEADRLVARAIESVLGQVPGMMDTSVPEASAAKMQPWAETAAPTGARTKRPLEELLAELEARVSADPGARATLPQTRHPALTFFDRFVKGARVPGGGGERSTAEPGSRRRRRRRGGSGAAHPAEASAASAPPAAEPARGTGRRRSRRGRGGGAAVAGGDGSAAATPRQPVQRGQAPAAGGDAGARTGPSTGSRRRRGRRGRGGPRPPAA